MVEEFLDYPDDTVSDFQTLVDSLDEPVQFFLSNILNRIAMVRQSNVMRSIVALTHP